MRSRVYANPKPGFVPKLLNNLSFLFTSAWAGRDLVAASDVLIASSPPFFPHVSGALLAARSHVPLVLEVRDLWPDYLVQLGILGRRGAATRALFALERRLLRRAQLVVAVTESFRQRIIAKGVPEDRVIVVPNGVDTAAYDVRAAEAIPTFMPNDGRPIVGYLGTFGRGQGLADVVRAMTLLSQRGIDLHLVLVGDGPDRPAVARAVEASGLRSVHIHPPIPRTETKGFYQSCDVCLVPLAPIPIFQETIPSKIFEIMACERPLVASLEGEAARIITDSRGGVLASPGNPASIADAIATVLALPAAERREMGRRAREHVVAYFDRTRLADRYFETLTRLVGHLPTPVP